MTSQQHLFVFICILARVSSFVAFLPMFAQKQLPKMVKAGLAVSLTLFWYGVVSPDAYPIQQINVVTSLMVLGQEIAIGFILSMLLGFMFVPAKIAGAYVGQEVGLSLAAVSSPGSSDSSTLVTTVFETFAVLIFFGLDLHHFMVSLLHYSMVDLGGMITLTDLPTAHFVDMSSALFEFGNLIAGPVGVCLFILTVGLGLLNKAAPALNLFSVGMTMRSAIGLICLVIFMPIVMRAMAMYFHLHQIEIEKFLIYFLSDV